jgi:MFS family permease
MPPRTSDRGRISYLELFRGAPGLLRLTSFGLLGRTPSGMAGVALLLLVVGEGGSYSVAGLASALFSGGAALGGVAYARLIVRRGYRTPLTSGGLVGGLALALVPVVAVSTPAAVYLTFIAAAGLTFPPLAACVRSQWNRAYADPERLLRAATFESVVGEVAFLVGPALVTVAVTSASEALPFVLAGAMVVVASAGFGRFAIAPPSNDGPAVPLARPSLWRPRFALTLVAGALWCVSFGALTVGIVAAADEAGWRALGGLLVALVSVGAIAGGLAFGARAWQVSPGVLLVVVLAAYASCLAPLVLAQRSILVLAIFLVLAGTSSAAVLACLNLRVVEDVLPAREVEAYSWLNGFTVAGLAIGPAIGGQFVDLFGSEGAFAAASAFSACAALVALRAR